MVSAATAATTVKNGWLRAAQGSRTMRAMRASPAARRVAVATAAVQARVAAAAGAEGRRDLNRGNLGSGAVAGNPTPAAAPFVFNASSASVKINFEMLLLLDNSGMMN
jgi:hypothetical protein